MADFQPTVVLAEDDADDILFFQECFKEVCVDIKLLVVKNGQDLIELLDTGINPAAIFLDLNMPKLDGKQCLLEIRKRPLLKQTKILILSTSSWESDIEYCLLYGANEYYIKPSNIEKLKSYIKFACSNITSKPHSP